MTLTAGLDIGSTYAKAVLLDSDNNIVARALRPSGFKLGEVAQQVLEDAMEMASVRREEVSYVVTTGIGRHQAAFRDLHVTDLTAGARGAVFLFPGTHTVLDIGGQTMKATKVDDDKKVVAFRLNDKCAAGTGAFLEKTARYMGYETEKIGPLMATALEPVAISGVCAVFAESEVINHLSTGTPPADIMQGAIESLTGRAVQLIKRVKAGPEYTLIGGILRFATMAKTVRTQLGAEINVPEADLPQYVGALGAAVLGHVRLAKLAEEAGTIPV